MDVSSDQLQRLVEGRHGGKAVLVDALPLKEVWNGQTVWEGIVHIYDLEGQQGANGEGGEGQAPPPPPGVSVPRVPAAVPANDGIGAIISVLERLRDTPLATQVSVGMSPQQQMSALQAGTAMHLLHAGTNMLLMYSGLLDHPPVEPPAPPVETPPPPPPPVHITERSVPKETVPLPDLPERPIASAAITAPVTFTVPGDTCPSPHETIAA